MGSKFLIVVVVKQALLLEFYLVAKTGTVTTSQSSIFGINSRQIIFTL